MHVSRQGIGRIVAVLVGAAVLFGLEHRFGMPVYFAIPAGALAYLVTLVAMGLVLGTDPQAK